MICLAPYQPFMIRSEEKCQGYLLNFHPDFFCTYRHQNEIETEGFLFNNFHGLPYFTVNEQRVKQVAAFLGYDDEFYFSRFFKKKVGVSPDIYRKTVGFAKLESN
ncbi:AraC family transcriptional regulator [Salinimicrobium sp. TIG7-5_MAKvit]|uniref:AraC family transcriptional regulator n=1 Tax=Salinimicrobium sp. TIG7-5_MAKvit TaxID=3121289 RepID=UPI003C6E3ABA